MYPVITCMADGQEYKSTDPARRTPIDIDNQYYLFSSTTVIKITNSSTQTYDCRITFTEPDVPNNPNYEFIVRNEPNFTANITGERMKSLTKNS